LRGRRGRTLERCLACEAEGSPPLERVLLASGIEHPQNYEIRLLFGTILMTERHLISGRSSRDIP
jgi:hypothetical protein